MNAREMAEFKSKVWTNDEVTLDVVADLSVATPLEAEKVRKLFVQRGYFTDRIPGEFFKIFTLGDKEIADLEQTLAEIEQLGLREVFQSNLRVACFKRTFLEQLKVFLNNNFPYLNQDNTFIRELFLVDFAKRLQTCIDSGLPYETNGKFIKELYDAKAFREYVERMGQVRVEQPQSSEVAPQEEDIRNKMDEDRQVYNEIVERLNYLILQNPTNEYLPIVVRNITSKVIEALSRKEYRFLSRADIVSRVMFEGIDVTPEMKSVEDLVLSAFPEDRELNEGRGL